GSQASREKNAGWSKSKRWLGFASGWTDMSLKFLSELSLARGLSALGEPGELVEPALVLAQHLRPHDRPEQPGQQASLGLLGDDRPPGAVGVEKPHVMRGRAERLPGPGEPSKRLVHGDLGGDQRAEGDPREAASELQLRP